MITHRDCLLEIGTEELPARFQNSLASALAKQLATRCAAMSLPHGSIKTFATPRRIAVLIEDLACTQPPQQTERLGPKIERAYDSSGAPSIACLGFARSVGVRVDQLKNINTTKGQRVGVIIEAPGKQTKELLPDMVNEAIKKLPISRPMRWSSHTLEFIRPVHWVVLMLGKEVVPATVLQCKTSRETQGHRFAHPTPLTINDPRDYNALLYSQGFVVADTNKRKSLIKKQIAKTALPHQAIVPEALLDEVTALVEWPVVLKGQFDPDFLAIPQEALITCLQTHQKVFAIANSDQQLTAQFLLVSNIESRQPNEVIKGNERVIKARLSDAKFFFENDLKIPLETHLKSLKDVIFQKDLGSLEAKTHRIAKLSSYIAKQLDIAVEPVKRAATLAKCDLLSEMVGEFPSLQGIMGSYYAQHNNEAPAVSLAIKEHYQPRFAKDSPPRSIPGCCVALADKLDTLIGIFGINQSPTGDKDPFALRRAALAVLRILIEKALPMDLKDLLKQAKKNYSDALPNQAVIQETLDFIQQRLKAYYQEQGIRPEIFAAVQACNITEPYDFDRRIKAVEHFTGLPEASALAAANKRVCNILRKQNVKAKDIAINNSLFTASEEKILVDALSDKMASSHSLYQAADYTASLSELSSLKEPIDRFFDNVMIMAEDPAIRNNRIAILQSIQQLFGKVADISQLS